MQDNIADLRCIATRQEVVFAVAETMKARLNEVLAVGGQHLFGTLAIGRKAIGCQRSIGHQKTFASFGGDGGVVFRRLVLRLVSNDTDGTIVIEQIGSTNVEGGMLVILHDATSPQDIAQRVQVGNHHALSEERKTELHTILAMRLAPLALEENSTTRGCGEMIAKEDVVGAFRGQFGVGIDILEHAEFLVRERVTVMGTERSRLHVEEQRMEGCDEVLASEKATLLTFEGCAQNLTASVVEQGKLLEVAFEHHFTRLQFGGIGDIESQERLLMTIG